MGTRNDHTMRCDRENWWSRKKMWCALSSTRKEREEKKIVRYAHVQQISKENVSTKDTWTHAMPFFITYSDSLYVYTNKPWRSWARNETHKRIVGAKIKISRLPIRCVFITWCFMKFITWTNECISILCVVPLVTRPISKIFYIPSTFFHVCGWLAGKQYLVLIRSLSFAFIPFQFRFFHTFLLLYLFRSEDVSNFSSSY